MRTIVIAAVLSSISLTAQARQHVVRRDPACNVTMPCDFSYDAPQRSTTRTATIPRHKMGRQVRLARPGRVQTPNQAYTLARPSRFIPGRLICAINVGVALAERGIKGTGSAMALSYLHWGHSAGGPVPGAVIVSRRRGGGHVAIVSRVEGDKVFAWNATGGKRGWQEIAYHHRVLDYRVPN